MEYDAFISYSHDRDGAVAPRLREALRRVGRGAGGEGPKVFLDESALSASPALWSSIAGALDRSRFLVLLASPEAARSEWVDRELRYWLETRSVDSILQVLTGGDLVWDPVMGDFSPDASTSLAPALAGQYSEEPRFVDMRWSSDNGFSGSDPRLRSAAAQIAAPLVGVSPEELHDDDAIAVRKDRRLRTVMLAAVAVLVVAVAVAAFWGVDRSWRLNSDSASSRTAGLAQQAVRLRDERPDIAALAAVEAADALAAVGEGDARAALALQVRAALMDTVVTPPRRDLHTGTGRRIVTVAISEPQVPFGDTPGRHQMMASLDDGGSVRVWDLGYGGVEAAPVAELEVPPPDAKAGNGALSLSPDAAYISVATAGGVQVFTLAASDSPRVVANLQGARPPMRFAPPGGDLVVDARGALWDLTCAHGPDACGAVAAAWSVPDPDVQAAELRWNPPAGTVGLLWTDSLTGTTITRREWSIGRGVSGLEASAIRESAVVQDACASAKCRLLSFASGILVDAAVGPRNHTLTLVSYGDAGLTALPSVAKLPYEPVGTLANARGYTPNDPVPDRFVVMTDHDGNLYVQPADTGSGMASMDARATFHSGGDSGAVDGTGSYLVAGDARGVVHLFTLTPGQSFVNAGLPDRTPAIPLEGTGLKLVLDGQPDADCCDLRATTADGGTSVALGHAAASQVRARDCPSGTFVAVPGAGALRVVRMPDSRAAVVPLPPAQDDRPAPTISISCGSREGSVLVAIAGVGVREVSFGRSGPQGVDAIGPPDCCTIPAHAVTLSQDGSVLVTSRARGQAKGDSSPGDIAVFEVATGRRLDVPPDLGGARAPIVAATPAPAEFVVGRGTTVSLLTVREGVVSVRHLFDTDAPIASLSVRPDASEVVIGTSATIEIVALDGGDRLGEPIRLPGTPRFDGDGALWIHPLAYRNPLLYARADLDMESLRDRACALVAREPAAEEWDGVAGHLSGPLCSRGDDGKWQAVDR